MMTMPESHAQARIILNGIDATYTSHQGPLVGEEKKSQFAY